VGRGAAKHLKMLKISSFSLNHS